MGTDDTRRQPPSRTVRADVSSPGWHADPFGRHVERWNDGDRWTERVRDGRLAGIDPPGIETAPRSISKEVHAPASPIDDAVLPIRRPRVAGALAMTLGCVVFLGLVAVLVVSLVT